MSKMVILGAGESGVGAAILAPKEGYMYLFQMPERSRRKYRSVLEKKELNLKKENTVKKEYWMQMK